MSTRPQKGDLMAMLAELERGLSPSPAARHSEDHRPAGNPDDDRPLTANDHSGDRPVAAIHEEGSPIPPNHSEERPLDESLEETSPFPTNHEEDRPLAEIVRMFGARQEQPAPSEPALEIPAQPAHAVEREDPQARERFFKADFAAIRAESLRADGMEHALHNQDAPKSRSGEDAKEARTPWRPMLAAAAVVVALGGVAAGYVFTGEAPDSSETALINAEAELGGPTGDKTTLDAATPADSAAPTDEASIPNPPPPDLAAAPENSPPASREARVEEGAPAVDAPNEPALSAAEAPIAPVPQELPQAPARVVHNAIPMEPSESIASPAPSEAVPPPPVDISPPAKAAAPRPTQRATPATSETTPRAPEITRRAKPAPRPNIPAKTAERTPQKPAANSSAARVIRSPVEARRTQVEDFAEAPPPPSPPPRAAAANSGPFGFVKRATDSVARVVTDMGRMATGLIP